jgi:hypothetical protein
MQVAHDRDALDELLALQLEDEAQHTMGRGMLRAHVEDELLDLEPIVRFDDRKLDLRGVLDLTDFGVGGSQLSRP